MRKLLNAKTIFSENGKFRCLSVPIVIGWCSVMQEHDSFGIQHDDFHARLEGISHNATSMMYQRSNTTWSFLFNNVRVSYNAHMICWIMIQIKELVMCAQWFNWIHLYYWPILTSQCTSSPDTHFDITPQQQLKESNYSWFSSLRYLLCCVFSRSRKRGALLGQKKRA